MATGDVLTKHTIDASSLRDLVEVKVPVLSENGTNDTYIKKVCIKGLLSIDDIMDVDTLDFLIHVPFMLIMIIGGVFGNSLITWVLWRQQRRTLTGMLIAMVALTDNFVLLFYFLNFTLPTMYEYGQAFEHYYIFYSHAKIYIWFSYVTSRTMSIYAVVLVVANRYLGVACSSKIAYLRKITYAKLGMALVIAFSILVNWPQILLFESSPYFDPCGGSWMAKIENSGLLHQKKFIIAYQLWFHLIMFYLFPAAILLFCLLKLRPYTKGKMSLPPANVEETLDNHLDEIPGDEDAMTDASGTKTGKPTDMTEKNKGGNEIEMKSPASRPPPSFLGVKSNPEGAGSVTPNTVPNIKHKRHHAPKKDFNDGDVESPAIVNERIVAVIYTFLFMHTLAIILHVIVTATRLNGERIGTGNKTSMVLSEFHELLLGSFSAIKFYLYIFIGRRYWRALTKTLKLCTNSKCKKCGDASEEPAER